MLTHVLYRKAGRKGALLSEGGVSKAVSEWVVGMAAAWLQGGGGHGRGMMVQEATHRPVVPVIQNRMSAVRPVSVCPVLRREYGVWCMVHGAGGGIRGANGTAAWGRKGRSPETHWIYCAPARSVPENRYSVYTIRR